MKRKLKYHLLKRCSLLEKIRKKYEKCNISRKQIVNDAQIKDNFKGMLGMDMKGLMFIILIHTYEIDKK
jgi:hypothetical protein